MFKLRPMKDMKMSAHLYDKTILLVAFAAISGVVNAQEDHGKMVEEHLEKALKSGKAGDAKGVISHTEEARKELIDDNEEHPYTHLHKPIYGEHQKAERDEEIFEEMDKAIEEAREGHTQEAVEAVERASRHLREKEEAK